MGTDKRLLKIQGEPFLDRVCRIMGEIFREVLVVNAIDDYDCSHLPVRVVTDHIPQKGSLGGLYTGLKEATHPLVFAVACDMPFLNPNLIRWLCAKPDCDVLVVRLGMGFQTLHARYSKNCCPSILECFERDDLRIQNLAEDPQLRVTVLSGECVQDLDPHHYSFLNINSPSDLEFVRKSQLDL